MFVVFAKDGLFDDLIIESFNTPSLALPLNLREGLGMGKIRKPIIPKLFWYL
jgi:hypothetical protein